MCSGIAALFAQNPRPSPQQGANDMNEDQIKYMVNRFLGWKLPSNFRPDAGISFKAEFNEHTAHPMKHEPTGTNLFDAQQAEAMVQYMVEGLPVEFEIKQINKFSQS
jgi:outer membrane receptor for ferrienterochelin and colicin